MNNLYRSFFVKNLLTLLIPLLIPITILGILSTVLIQQYIRAEISQANKNLLQQSMENIEMIFDEMDTLNMHIIASATQFTNLKSMMQKNLPTLDDYQQLSTLKSFIDSPSISKPYINSIYIYIENSNQRFISSAMGGIVSFVDYFDTGWYEDYVNHSPNDEIWTEQRSFEMPGANNTNVNTEVITIFRRITLSDNSKGVIVLNIKPSYISELLSKLETPQDQSYLILDSNHRLIFTNMSEPRFSLQDIQTIAGRVSSSFRMDVDDNQVVVNKMISAKYPWTFISIVPSRSLYGIPSQLTVTTVVLLIISLVMGSLLAYYLTRKNVNAIKLIISVFDSAQKGVPLPPMPSKDKDVFGYIIQSILNNFIERNYLRVQLSERKYKSQALELAALQSQMNPHFLFNTLETLNWKALKLGGKPNEVNEMIGNLSDILRYSLEGNGELVTLKTEVKETLPYIEIQKMRYKDKFNVIWDCDPETLKYHVLKLSLQPLIENSLYHGIKEKEGKGQIKVRTRLINSRLVISIVDNGVGILPERLEAIRETLEEDPDSQNHIGLFNTDKRMKLIYGSAYRIQIRSKFAWGTAIYMSIPVD
ncbi:histidine kinase [Paenibacillus sp. HN-1]|uniref:cache domain-containing sensor histidine kinase n=1 Tax=Paenibacillus TaxID=44249 RepID=UPI001CA91926|nr:MULTISPECIES: histidine kinase [Paenibacillus]MBY9078125.1 histidine kinase [Paenibacillus sp. CGMCC 1.18879]MBY9083866.1 histidine kinase [Paenibacillus sinensis]